MLHLTSYQKTSRDTTFNFETDFFKVQIVFKPSKSKSNVKFARVYIGNCGRPHTVRYLLNSNEDYNKVRILANCGIDIIKYDIPRLIRLNFYEETTSY